MKTNKIISAWSIAIILGFCVGFTNSVCDIISNRYISYRMFRLVVLTFQKNLNLKIFLFLAIASVAYILWFWIVEKIKCDKVKIVRVILMAFVILIMFLSLNWFLKSFSGFTLRLILEILVVNIRNSLTGEGTFDFLQLLTKYGMIILVSLAGGIIVMLCLFKVLTLLLKVLFQFQITIKMNTKKFALIVIVLIIILNICVIGDNKLNTPQGPNIILLVVDAWRADSLGCYNIDSKNTPNIDKFAEKAVLFQNFIAQGSCTINSAPSIFCSVYPSEHGYFNFRNIVSSKFNSLAELLKNEGYQTFGISTNPHVTSLNGLSQGFDVFIEDCVWKRTNCDEVNDIFVKWLDNNKHKTFFAMLWYIDPHEPYHPPREYIDKYLSEEQKELAAANNLMTPGNAFTSTERKVSKKLYDGEVNFYDAEFAKLIDFLKQNNLMDNSVILLTSDHGESFWEKKYLGKEVSGHGTSLYEEQIKIPFIVSLPNQSEGKIILEKAQHVDIVPTVLEYAGVSPRVIDDLHLRGNSLKSVIEEGEKLKRQHFYSQLITSEDGSFYMECVQDDNFKFTRTHRYEELFFSPPHLALFDLNSNESEVESADETTKRLFADLEKRLVVWEGNLEKTKLATKPVEYKNKEEEDKLMERLKSLGYLK